MCVTRHDNLHWYCNHPDGWRFLLQSRHVLLAMHHRRHSAQPPSPSPAVNVQPRQARRIDVNHLVGVLQQANKETYPTKLHSVPPCGQALPTTTDVMVTVGDERERRGEVMSKINLQMENEQHWMRWVNSTYLFKFMNPHPDSFYLFPFHSIFNAYLISA